MSESWRIVIVVVVAFWSGALWSHFAPWNSIPRNAVRKLLASVKS